MRRAPGVLLAALLTAGPAAGQVPAELPPVDAPKIQAPDPDARRLQIGLALGPGIDLVHTTSGRVGTAWVPRLSIRFPAREGWSPTVGFGWFDAGVDGDQFGRLQHIGEIQLRPVMVGARYTWVRDAWSYDVAATAGLSFSDFDLDGAVARTLLVRDPVLAEANTSLATKLQGGVWYDVNERVSLRGTLGIFRCEPEVTVTAGGVSRRFKQSANAVQLGASVVYRLF